MSSKLPRMLPRMLRQAVSAENVALMSTFLTTINLGLMGFHFVLAKRVRDLGVHIERNRVLMYETWDEMD